MSTSGANINLTTDIAGNYTFTFNSSNRNLTVTYPTIYKVTYSHVPTAAADAPTTSPSVTSGNSVVAGTSVTFTAKDANPGYAWKGWYSNNAGSGTELSANQTYKTSITANTTIYAVYMSAVTLDNQGTTGGKFWATPTQEFFVQGEEITLTATAEECYEFVSWTIKKTSNGSDVTSSVLSGNTLTMPDYAVTVYATFKSLSVTEIALSKQQCKLK